ncbi:MAG: aspartate kinase, partial [Candidatus Peregrinibacteria bacterium]|nr:aspartate kinase [Candidatus Peregrinibacteria bacterium]
MKILKFGGTSMGTEESLENVVKIITDNYKKQEKIVVTCSAMSGVTDQLIQIGELAEKDDLKGALAVFKKIKKDHFAVAEIFGVAETFFYLIKPVFRDLGNLIQGIAMLRELSTQSQANIHSFGERFSTILLSEILKTKSIPAVQFDSNFVKTKGHNLLEDEVDWEETTVLIKEKLEPVIKRGQIPIVTGFFGTKKNGGVSLLGRGGSDYTGAILAVCLGAKDLEIWTDVDGFLSADPRVVKNAQIIPEIGYTETSELCFFGAKVLYPKSIRPVIESNGNVWIKNTFNPENVGTKIIKESLACSYNVQSIASKEVVIISLDIFGGKLKKSELFAKLFTFALEKKISIDAIASSESVISFCIEKICLTKKFLKELEGMAPVKITKDRKILCIVSPPEVQGKVGVAAGIFGAISDSG